MNYMMDACMHAAGCMEHGCEKLAQSSILVPCQLVRRLFDVFLTFKGPFNTDNCWYWTQLASSRGLQKQVITC